MNKSKISITLFDKYATNFQDEYMGLDLYNASFDLFCDSVKGTDPTILEVGCGPGNITKYVLEKRPDFNILGIDLSPKMLDLARANNPTADFKLMDCRNINAFKNQLPRCKDTSYEEDGTYLIRRKHRGIKPTGGNKFNAILCGFCLPYLSKQEALTFIYNASQLLKPQGVLYISTMEGNYSDSGFKSSSSASQEQLYIHYHQEDYLIKALKENGFKQIHIDRKDYIENDEVIFNDLLIVAIN